MREQNVNSDILGQRQTLTVISEIKTGCRMSETMTTTTTTTAMSSTSETKKYGETAPTSERI